MSYTECPESAACVVASPLFAFISLVQYAAVFFVCSVTWIYFMLPKSTLIEWINIWTDFYEEKKSFKMKTVMIITVSERPQSTHIHISENFKCAQS